MTIRILATAAAVLFSTVAPAAAATSYTGTFVNDNDKAVFNFVVNNTSKVNLISRGYFGGVNAAGEVIAPGGFDTVLSIYDSTGALVVDNDDYNDDGLDTPTGLDSRIFQVLDAGSYSVYLTQYNNFGPLQLPGEFGFDGQPDFRSGFIDFYGNQRTGNYALDISVPEASTLALIGVALAGAIVARRRKTA